MKPARIALFLAVVALSISTAAAARTPRACVGEDDPGWQVEIPDPKEKGEALVVEGTVYGADGKTPLSGVLLYVYHTDVEGLYSKGGSDEAHPRLCGTMRTDARGRYRFTTIRPGSYPRSRIPAHVHYVVRPGSERAERFDLEFADDPLFSRARVERALAGDRKDGTAFGRIRPVTRDEAGVQRVQKDLRLRHGGRAS